MQEPQQQSQQGLYLSKKRQERIDFHTVVSRAIDLEVAGIRFMKQHLCPDRVGQGCRMLMECQGKVIVTGMGKSGHIGKKMAATLASTGTAAFFVHPGEASHGDMGMIAPGDVVIALSNSGETEEIKAVIPLIKRLGIPFIAITGRSDCTLSQQADVALFAGVEKEACPLDLAPTASTTAALVLGDAIAVALLEAKGFTAQDFAYAHPGGNLGKRLLLKVEDIMHKGEQLPQVSPKTSIKEALLEMTCKGLGITCIVADNQLIGVFTDGDLRRTLDNNFSLTTPIKEVMCKTPKVVSAKQLAAEVLSLMEASHINAVIVTDHNTPIGALNMHDLLTAGVY